MLLGGAVFLDWPLSWVASISFFAGVIALRTARPMTGGEETEGEVVAHVVRPVRYRGGRRPALAERVRYRARGLDGVVREFEVVDSLASSVPGPPGTKRRVSYHPGAPADARILRSGKKLVGWWFVVCGLWVLVLMNLSAGLVPLAWVLASALLCVGFALRGPSSPVPPTPPPGAAWQPPPPSWPEATDDRGLVPGLQLHLNRTTLTSATIAGAGSAAAVALLRHLV